LKAIIFSGCPRKNGNTMKLVNRFIEGLKDGGCEFELIDTNKLSIHPCAACGYCEKKGDCCIDDEMKEIYKKTEESKIIVIASPVYFASVSAQLKTLIDRFQVFYNRRYVLKTNEEVTRKGYLIFTAGLKNEKIISSMELLAKFFMLSCNADLKDPIFVMGTDEVSVDDREELLYKAYKAGYEAAISW
jgi:multimeric flavodoxin WrbA